MPNLSMVPDHDNFFPQTKLSIDIEAGLRQQYDAIGIDELEQTLRDNIQEFRKQPGKHGQGYRALAAAIEVVLYDYLESNGVEPDVIENIIDKRVPSHTYIRNFKEGQSICINYMNTMAFFFGVKYLVNNFGFEI